MTLVAVWKFAEERIHAVADARISSGPGNVLTDHGPKILPITMVCRKPGPSGFFDQEAFRVEYGFAFAGSTLAALSTHALANVLCSNLVGAPDASAPTMDEIAYTVGTVAFQYMKEIGQLGGEGSFFRAVLFGHCPRTGQPLAFQYEPSAATGELSLNIQKHVLGDQDVVIIGASPQILRDRINSIRVEGVHPIVFADAPKNALRGLINESAIDSVGGKVQQAWSIPFKLEIVATMEGIQPVAPSPRNAGLFVLGFDIMDTQSIGSFIVSMTGR